MMRSTKALAAGLLLFAFQALSAGEPGVKLPTYKKTVLKNGMTVLFMEQHKVPLVDLHFTVRTGTAQDPAGKEGLAALTISLLRKGTRTRSADRISTELDSMGATYTAMAGLDASTCTAEFMKKDVADGLGLFADLILSPVFPEAEVQKLRAQRIDSVRAAKDSAQGVIRTYYNAFLFGDHPYGRPQNGDEHSLVRLTRADVEAFHAAHFVPAHAVLAVVGDFQTAEMEKLVSDQFGPWRAQGAPDRTQLGPPQPQRGRKLLLVDKPDATQTFFMVGNLGVARNNPDRVGIQVINVLFGGRFTSMINTALRIKSGLTYGAQSDFGMFKVPGPFAVSSFTANATTGKALDLTLATLKELQEKGISEADLASAKAYVKGTLPPKTLETGQQLAAVLADLQLYGLPDSEVNAFFAKVDALTMADAKRIIQTYFPEKDLCFVLIGKASEIRPMVEKFAPELSLRNISDPGF
ncbi:MAG TPA: pitrilysin family protein [Holophagaceae bacterium]